MRINMPIPDLTVLPSGKLRDGAIGQQELPPVTQGFIGIAHSYAVPLTQVDGTRLVQQGLRRLSRAEYIAGRREVSITQLPRHGPMPLAPETRYHRRDHSGNGQVLRPHQTPGCPPAGILGADRKRALAPETHIATNALTPRWPTV